MLISCSTLSKDMNKTFGRARFRIVSKKEVHRELILFLQSPSVQMFTADNLVVKLKCGFLSASSEQCVCVILYLIVL